METTQRNRTAGLKGRCCGLSLALLMAVVVAEAAESKPTRALRPETAAWWTFDNHLRDDAHGLALKNIPNPSKAAEASYQANQFNMEVPVLALPGGANQRSYYRWGAPQVTRCQLADELDAPGPWTIEAYLKPRCHGVWKNRPRLFLLRKYRVGPGEKRGPQWLVEIRQPPKKAPQSRQADLWVSATFQTPDGKTAVCEVTAKNAVQMGRWQRMAVVYDGKTLSVVMDGKPAASVATLRSSSLRSTSPGPGPGARLLPSGGKSLLLISNRDQLPDGAWTPRGTPELSTHYPGWIDELRFTRAALSGDQLLPPVQTIGRGPLPDPPKRQEYTSIARRHLDVLMKHGADLYGPAHSPLLASTLDPKTLKMVKSKPPILPGMRHPCGPGASPLYGCDLERMRDTLTAMRALSGVTGDPRYAEHADRALRFWLTHCPYPSGVWPVGEHGVYNFYTEKPQPRHPHEPCAHLHWPTYYAVAPDVVAKEIDLMHKIHVFKHKGLWFHGRHGSVKGGAHPVGGCGFARQSGLFARAWAFMYSKTKDPKYLRWAKDQIDLLWHLRDPKTGLAPGQVFPPPGTTRGAITVTARRYASEQTISAALGFLEAAEWLDDPAEKKFFIERGTALAMPNFNVFYKWDGRKFTYTRLRWVPQGPWYFLQFWERAGRPAHVWDHLERIADDTVAKWRPLKRFESGRCGLTILFLVRMYNETGNDRYLQFARRLGDYAAANYVAENGVLVGSVYYRIYDRMYNVPKLTQALLALDHPKHPAVQPFFRVVR